MREFNKIDLISDRYHMGMNGIALDRTNIGFISMDNSNSIDKIGRRDYTLKELNEAFTLYEATGKGKSLSKISKRCENSLRIKLQTHRSSYPIRVLDTYRISLDLKAWKNPRYDETKERDEKMGKKSLIMRSPVQGYPSINAKGHIIVGTRKYIDRILLKTI